MHQMRTLITHIMNDGVDRDDRTGTGTRAVFAPQMRFDLTKGFPLDTSKFVPFGLIKSELLWFLAGDTNIRYLLENKNHIWDEWPHAAYVKMTGDDIPVEEFADRILVDQDFADKWGDIGPGYGRQWKSWPDYRISYTDEMDEQLRAKGYELAGAESGISDTPNVYRRDIDQIANVIEKLKAKPEDRRIIVSAWNVADVESGEMKLPPCHALFQFFSAPMSVHERIRWLEENDKAKLAEFTAEDPRMSEWDAYLDDLSVPSRRLSCQLYQRSADTFIGIFFNVPSYSLLTHMVAQVTNHAVGEFIWTGGDTHIYNDHFDAIKEYMECRDDIPLPKLKLNPDIKNIDDFTMDDISVEGYQFERKIYAPVAV